MAASGWLDFNPRPREGRHNEIARLAWLTQFQSTPREGQPADTGERYGRSSYFNPRPVKGATWHMCRRRRSSVYFNPRPVKGRRELTLASRPTRRDFNPRPREGATRSSLGDVVGSTDFNPRPVKGATLLARPEDQPHRISIHAPVKGTGHPLLLIVRLGHRYSSAISIHAMSDPV